MDQREPPDVVIILQHSKPTTVHMVLWLDLLLTLLSICRAVQPALAAFSGHLIEMVGNYKVPELHNLLIISEQLLTRLLGSAYQHWAI